jgi:hypothetical protein
MLIGPPLQGYFCVSEKQIAMLQLTLSSNRLPVKIIQPSLAVKNNLPTDRDDKIENTCKHRNENGWCSKSLRQCSLSVDSFLKH